MRFLIFLLILSNIFIWSEITKALDQKNEVSFLDVGQGTSVLLAEPKISILYDAGPNGLKLTKALDRHLPLIRKKVDILILSHADQDHYNGAFDLINRFPPRIVVISPKDSAEAGWQALLQKIKAKNIAIIALKTGSLIETPGKKLFFLNPPINQINSLNDNQSSIVIKAIEPTSSFLLAGDIDKKTEFDLIKKYNRFLQVDYLLIPHHGSKYSSGDEFLKTILPRLAVIQVGKNRYGHPNGETIQRLKNNQIPFWRTDLQGELTIR